MPIIHKRYCKNCGSYYEGVGRIYCSNKCRREYDKKHKKTKNEIDADYRERNREKIKERWKIFREKHREKLLEYNRNYTEKNRERLRKYKHQYFKEHYKPKPITNKTMEAKSRIAKGKLLENYVAQVFRDSGLDIRARRTFGSGSGLEKGDINNSLGLNIECKNTQRFQWSYWQQSERDSKMSHTEPILIWHPPNKPLEDSIAIMRLSYFVEILARQKGEIISNKDNDLKFKLRRLKDLIRQIDKKLEYE